MHSSVLSQNIDIFCGMEKIWQVARTLTTMRFTIKSWLASYDGATAEGATGWVVGEGTNVVQRESSLDTM